MKQKLTEKLKKLDFIKDRNLYFTDDKPDNPYIRIALEEAKKFNQVQAVYFRRFDQDSRPPLAQAYIFDFSDKAELPDDFGETVKNVWLTGKIPLIYAFTQTDVSIISGYKQPEFKDSNYQLSTLDIIKIADLSEKKIYSAKKLDNGSFWDETKYQKDFKFENSSYEILLKKLKQMLNDIVDREESSDKKRSREFYQRLLLRAILVKYLEERVDENGDRIFPSNFFSQFSKSEDTFIAVLERKGAIIKLFQALESQFNGNIFRLNEIECDILENKDLSLFLRFFDGYVDQKEQLHIWELYSFNYLPIELISNIYEEFLPKVKGVVYTPPFLVDFLIDQCMSLQELKEKTGNFKVIDPACGSGVFLVAAFKRLVQAWRVGHNWRRPPVEILKHILNTCIFGIDIQKESIQLAAFSLTIALCDQLSPKKIRELQFDDLFQKNLIEKDFFSIILNENNIYDEYQNTFDLVIGNPPFESKLKTTDAKKIETIKIKKRGFKLPDNQISLLFIESAPKLSKSNAKVCLIQPAGPSLYNPGSFAFRTHLFKNFKIPRIYDFTPLEAFLFGKANVATTAFIVENTIPTKEQIYHITIRRTSSSKERMFFELDNYDFHRVSFQDAIENRLIWKANLLGGGRLRHISKRLQHIRTFEQYLNKKIRENNWIVSEGFIIGNKQEINELKELKNKTTLSDQDIDKLIKLKKKYKKANFITEKPFLPTITFNESGIDNYSIITQKSEYFLRPRDKSIYSPPHLLIKKGITKTTIPIELRSDYVTFKHRIIGIHVDPDQKYELAKIENYIKSNKSLLGLMALVSSTYMISRATAFNKDDLLSLPYPKKPEELKLSTFEQILIDDALDYQIEFRRKGEKAKVMQPVEKKQNFLNFSEVYLKVLNSVYKEFKASEPIRTTSFICYPFFFGEKPEQDLEEFKNNTQQLEKHLETLIKHPSSPSLRINRILRIYEKNIIYLIKPNQLRYWLKSIAIRDADETVADFIEQGF